MRAHRTPVLVFVLTLLLFWASAEIVPYQQRLSELERSQVEDEMAAVYDDANAKEAAYWILRGALMGNPPAKPTHARSQQNVMDTDEESRESLRTTVVQRAAKRWKVKCNNPYWKFCKG